MIFTPALRCWGARDGTGYVANLPGCWPLPILCPDVKFLGVPKRKGLCSQFAFLLATVDIDDDDDDVL